jgi:hypothetical protein
MELRKKQLKKSLKFLTLLLTAMLIATASAAVYYSLTITTRVTVSTAKVKFVEGRDWPSSSLLGKNSTNVFLTLKAYPNVTLTYQTPLNISNTDTVTHNVSLTPVSVTPASGSVGIDNFTFINFTLIQSNGNPVTGGTFDYTTTGNTWNTPSPLNWLQLAASTMWTVEIQTRAAAGATNGTSCSLVIALNVE